MRFRADILVFAALGCTAATAQPAAPCSKDYPALKDQEMLIIDEGGVLEESVDDPKQLKPEQLALVDKANALLESRTRIADQKDVEIIDGARTMLRDESVWNRADNRKCTTGDSMVSLFCALEFASRQVTGEYRHRRTGLEEVRFALEDATKGRDYQHRLMEFNNDPRTGLADIYAVLASARSRLVERLRLQEECKL